MKRILLIFITTILSFNVGALIIIMKNYGVNSDIDLVIKAHYEVTIYALKCGAIGVVVDYFSKDWFNKKDK